MENGRNEIQWNYSKTGACFFSKNREFSRPENEKHMFYHHCQENLRIPMFSPMRLEILLISFDFRFTF